MRFLTRILAFSLHTTFRQLKMTQCNYLTDILQFNDLLSWKMLSACATWWFWKVIHLESLWYACCHVHLSQMPSNSDKFAFSAFQDVTEVPDPIYRNASSPFPNGDATQSSCLESPRQKTCGNCGKTGHNRRTCHAVSVANLNSELQNLHFTEKWKEVLF